MLYGMCTHVGKIREKNEDFILVDHESGIFILADGMGGYKGGEIASREASLFLLSFLKHKVVPLQGISERKKGLETALELANRHIAGLVGKDSRLAGMGTTAVVALIEGNAVILGHVGDSRAYYITADDIRQLTKDHSLVQELLDHGTITEEEAAVHPKRHVITQALGSESPVSPEITAFKISNKGILLLCSDGLSGLVDAADIQKIVLSTSDLQGAAEALVDAANDAGGVDNISAVLITCKPSGEEQYNNDLNNQGEDQEVNNT